MKYESNNPLRAGNCPDLMFVLTKLSPELANHKAVFVEATSENP